MVYKTYLCYRMHDQEDEIIVIYYVGQWVLIIFKCIDYYRYFLNMDIYSQTIDYEDTSLKKYPYNKYIDAQELASLTHNIFDLKSRSRTIDVYPKKKKNQNMKKQTRKKAKKSLTTTINTACSSRANVSVRQKKSSKTIQNDEWKDLKKEQIGEELKHYKLLSFELRKENYSLKERLKQKSTKNKESIIQLQEKVNKLTRQHLQRRQQSLNVKEQAERKSKKKNIVDKQNQKQKKQLKNDFKRFFLHFMDKMGRVDQRLQKKILKQKAIQSKLLLGQNLLVQSSEFLRDKKYKFKCIYQ